MLLFRIVTVGVILLGCYGLIHEQTAALDANVLQIAIMGMTGVGKSSFINALGGLHVKDNSSASVCDGFESCTGRVNWYKTHVDDRPVYLIDTPGFGDTLRTPDDILAEIIDAFGQLYEYSHNKYIDGLIYLHNINDDAVGDVLKNYCAFENILGVESAKRTLLVTTRWPTDSTSGEWERLNKKKIQFYKTCNILTKNGAHTAPYSRKGRKEAQKLLRIVMDVPNPTALRSQRQLVDDHIPLEDTDAFLCLDKRGKGFMSIAYKWGISLGTVICLLSIPVAVLFRRSTSSSGTGPSNRVHLERRYSDSADSS